MHIVMVNWARIWDGTNSGGGVNGYAQGLALALQDRGHNVSWLCGGRVTESAEGTTEIGPVRIDRHADWMGVRVYEVINSPVLAPSLDQFRDPIGEISQPSLESTIGSFFETITPDIVHFHNLEGFSIGCVDRAKQSGASVVFSLHNYHTLCPQVYLMRGHRTPCRGYDAGRACETCIEAPDPTSQRLKQLRVVRAGPVAQPTRQSRDTLRTLRSAFVRAFTREPPADLDGSQMQQHAAPSHAPTCSPTRVCGSSNDALSTFPGPDTDGRGMTLQLMAESTPRVWQNANDPEWEVVSNTPHRDPTFDPTSAPLVSDSAYARRRHAMVRMLNSCDRVLAVSNFVRDLYLEMGVDRERLSAVTIGSRMPALAARHAELAFAPPPLAADPSRPIRLCFMGANHWYKGLPMLADALELLTPEYLRRFHLAIHAFGYDSIAWRFKRLEPRLAGLEIGGGYQPPDVPWICGGRDLGLVPSVWWDNGPQTVIEFLACGVPVLGANLGGVPDFVTHGVNGLLHRGNDRHDLARTLVEIARHPHQLDRLRTQVSPVKRMETHAEEIEAAYSDVIRARSRATNVSS